jgi:hypothetical protein
VNRPWDLSTDLQIEGRTMLPARSSCIYQSHGTLASGTFFLDTSERPSQRLLILRSHPFYWVLVVFLWMVSSRLLGYTSASGTHALQTQFIHLGSATCDLPRMAVHACLAFPCSLTVTMRSPRTSRAYPRGNQFTARLRGEP